MNDKSKIIIPAPKDIDYKEFKKDESTIAKYGLPEKVRFCKLCVISNQRPNSAVEHKHTSKTKKDTINLNADGICDACVLAEKKGREIDWEKRERELSDLCDKHRKNDSQKA